MSVVAEQKHRLLRSYNYHLSVSTRRTTELKVIVHILDSLWLTGTGSCPGYCWGAGDLQNRVPSRARDHLRLLLSCLLDMTTKRIFVITGGQGLLGQRVLHALLESFMITKCSTRAVLVDTSAPPLMGRSLTSNSCQSGHSDSPVSFLREDVTSPDLARAMKCIAAESNGDSLLSIFHLASVMSAEGEIDFERALSVNIDGELSPPKIQIFTIFGKQVDVTHSKVGRKALLSAVTTRTSSQKGILLLP